MWSRKAEANERAVETQDPKIFRRQAIKAAKDFCYGKEVIDKLNAAKTIDEMNSIMKAARKEKFK